MENLFESKLKIEIGEKETTPFIHKNNVYQDGTTPIYRDIDGTLWAMSGHTHMGKIAMFKGKTIADLKYLYPIETTFKTGKAGEAFDCIRYPEGVLPRGSIWPFGLYICPKTHRFFAFFHNETGWNGNGTGYTVFKEGNGEPDFRHIGMMHSDDEGKTWIFDRWVITAEDVCFSKYYKPENINVLGQSGKEISLGAGDFTLFIPKDDDYIYLIYNLLRVNGNDKDWEDATKLENKWLSCKLYIARTRKRDDGTLGDFVKYYNGSFCEAGNLGKESPILDSAWHSRIVYLKNHGIYMLSSCPFDDRVVVENTVTIRTSTNLFDWSGPIKLQKDGKTFGDHYCAFYSANPEDYQNEAQDELYLQLNGNGEDVYRYKIHIKEVK